MTLKITCSSKNLWSSYAKILINLTTITNCSCGSNLPSHPFHRQLHSNTLCSSTQLINIIPYSPSLFLTERSSHSTWRRSKNEMANWISCIENSMWTTKHAKQQPRNLLNKLDLINAGKPAPQVETFQWCTLPSDKSFAFPNLAWCVRQFSYWGLYMIIGLSVYISLAISWLK